MTGPWQRSGHVLNVARTWMGGTCAAFGQLALAGLLTGLLAGAAAHAQHPAPAATSRSVAGREPLVAEGIIAASPGHEAGWWEGYVPVRIQGHAVTLLWDTALSSYDLSLQNVQLPLTGQGQDVDAGTVDSLTIGTHTEYDVAYQVYHVEGDVVDAVPPRLPPFAGILGLGVIARYDIAFDGPARRIRVYQPVDALTAPARDSESLSHQDALWLPPGVTATDCIAMPRYHDGSSVPLVQVPVRANGVSPLGVFDSGSPFTVMNRAAFDVLALRLAAPTVRSSHVKASYMNQFVGKAPTNYDVTGVSLTIGPWPLRAMPILMVPDIPLGGSPAGEPILNLGLDAIQDRILFLSFSQQQLCLSAPRRPSQRPSRDTSRSPGR